MVKSVEDKLSTGARRFYRAKIEEARQQSTRETEGTALTQTDQLTRLWASGVVKPTEAMLNTIGASADARCRLIYAALSDRIGEGGLDPKPAAKNAAEALDKILESDGTFLTNELEQIYRELHGEVLGDPLVAAEGGSPAITSVSVHERSGDGYLGDFFQYQVDVSDDSGDFTALLKPQLIGSWEHYFGGELNSGGKLGHFSSSSLETLQRLIADRLTSNEPKWQQPGTVNVLQDLNTEVGRVLTDRQARTKTIQTKLAAILDGRVVSRLEMSRLRMFAKKIQIAQFGFSSFEDVRAFQKRFDAREDVQSVGKLFEQLEHVGGHRKLWSNIDTLKTGGDGLVLTTGGLRYAEEKKIVALDAIHVLFTSEQQVEEQVEHTVATLKNKLEDVLGRHDLLPGETEIGGGIERFTPDDLSLSDLVALLEKAPKKVQLQVLDSVSSA